jgi:predicted transcriptional regulator
MVASNSVRTSVILPERMHRQIQAVAAANDVSAAWVIRQAVLYYLSAQRGQAELPLPTGRE